MPLNKRNLRKIVAALDPSMRGELVAEQIREDVSDNLSHFTKQVSQTLSGLKKNLLAEIEFKLGEIPDHTGEIQALKKDFDTKLANLENVEVIQTQMQDLVTNDIVADESLKEDFESKIKKLRLEFLSRLNNIGGGSQNQKISVGGTLMSTKYADINLIAGANASITAADNNATKRVDITFVGTDTDTGMTQLTGDVTAGPGSGSQVATLASVLTAGGPIGDSTVIPIITWDAKGRLTVVSSVASGVVPSGQTYSITNVTTDRAYDANLTTVDEIADTLGTLIADLRAAKIIL